MSAVTAALPSPVEFSPVKFDEVFDPWASPDVTSESVEVLRASTEARPEDTTPETWPPTASPDEPLPDWFDVLRLLPSCTLSALRTPSTSARARCADVIPPV